MEQPIVRRREAWQFVLCALFALGAASDVTIFMNWMRGDNEAPAIVVWHGVTLAAALASLVSIWGRRIWAPYAVAAWGIASTALVFSLPLLLELPAEALGGIWLGGAVVGVFVGMRLYWRTGKW